MKSIKILLVISSLYLNNANGQNVGIGTTTPLQKLHVEGKLYVKDSIGINNSSPLANLDVKGVSLFRGMNTNDFTPKLKAGVEFFTGRALDGSLPAGLTTPDIAFDFGGSGGGYRHFISTSHQNAVGANGNSIDFYINNSSSADGSSAPGVGNILQMSVSPNGVGIGTKVINNNVKLHVSGKTFVEGNVVLTDTLFSRGIYSAGNAKVTDTLIARAIYSEADIYPVLYNNWKNSPATQPLSFYKDAAGRVHLSGTITGGGLAPNALLFVLPEGYRPGGNLLFAVSNGNAIVTIGILPDGSVAEKGLFLDNTFLSFDGVSFRAMY